MSTTLYGPIRAGQSHRQGESNTVVSDNIPGEISIVQQDDELVHFIWTNRRTRNVDLDLIIFPSDANFLKVSQSPDAKVHVLKFSSSDQRYFFWFQDPFPGAYESYTRNLNGLLEDPSFSVDRSGDEAGRSAAGPSAAPSAPAPSSGAAGAPLDYDALRALVANLPQGEVPTGGAPDLALSDILSPSSLAPLFSTATPETLRTIFPTLPSDLPIPPSEDALRRVVESPPFQGQVRALDRALSTGLLGSLVVGLGLPEEAGLGIRPFLNAIKEQAQKKKAERGGDSMDTD